MVTSEQVKAPDRQAGASPRGGAIALYVFFARADTLAPAGTPSGDREPAAAGVNLVR